MFRPAPIGGPLLGTALLLIAGAVSAQGPRSTLRGQVVDAHTGRPLVSASVALLPSEPLIGTATDSTGHFTLADVPVGFHTLKATHVGYEPLHVPEVWSRAGKETVLRVELAPVAHALETFSVSALARDEPVPLGVRAFTVEQSLRFPATFQDPARVVGTFPGVAAANDEANHFMVRGNSPNGNAWLLEGAEIVQPNHLTNAGTASDLPTLSGGGVSILSAQMLGTSRFLTGAMPMPYGNALGGIMDLELRRGNAREREWTAQAGLLGLDLSTEGPLGGGGRSSYLVNYRYSTVGLLGAMGVELGDEAITFQDLSFHVALPMGERNEVRLFGLGGTSSNVFEAERDTALWERDKDASDITYAARTGAVGGTLRAAIGERATLRTTVALSATEQERRETRYAEDLTMRGTREADMGERKLSVAARVDGALGGRTRYSMGGTAMERGLHTPMDSEVAGWLLRPYAHLWWDVTERLQAGMGAAYARYTLNDAEAVEPRASLQWRMAGGRRLGLGYGWRSQLPMQQAFGVRLAEGLPWNEGIGLTRSEDITLGYDHAVNERLSFRIEAYRQQLYDVPVLDPLDNAIGRDPGSLFNVWDEQVRSKLAGIGRAANTGMEASVSRAFAKGFFYHANASVFESTFAGNADDAMRASRWNRGWTANLLGGKEFAKSGEDRVRTWGVSGRVCMMGGLLATPMDTAASAAAGTTVHSGESWSERQGGFFRLDLRVYLRMDRKGRTGLWALDLQNATNARNEAYRYFDARKGEVVTRYQLGLIPNLSYRIEF